MTWNCRWPISSAGADYKSEMTEHAAQASCRSTLAWRSDDLSIGDSRTFYVTFDFQVSEPMYTSMNKLHRHMSDLTKSDDRAWNTFRALSKSESVWFSWNSEAPGDIERFVLASPCLLTLSALIYRIHHYFESSALYIEIHQTSHLTAQITGAFCLWHAHISPSSAQLSQHEMVIDSCMFLIHFGGQTNYQR